MNKSVIIILGATGDLSRHKIFPALYHLFMHKKLDDSMIIGAAIDDIATADLLERIKPIIKPKDENSWRLFGERIAYVMVDFAKEKDFERLNDLVTQLEQTKNLPGNRLVYCAAAPYFYCQITQHVAQSGLIKKMDREMPWQRIVYEKPFGHDLQSAHEINTCIANHFNEQQIFRIDHYLTKELVANIALVRFTNIFFEPLWNNRYIESVQIIFDEKLSVDDRGAFYDKYGALADIMQNHMMQLLALIAMEAPPQLTGDNIRAERAKVLQKVKVVDAVVGQYEGYLQEKGVAPHSTTETFAQVYLRIDNPRWAGVPFYLRTGKCLEKKQTAIYIKFKHVDCLLTHACPREPNYLTIQIEPESLFSLSINAKKPGTVDEVMPVHMLFCRDSFQTEIPQAYETLLEEILKGDHSVSVRFDEIEYAWKIIDAIRALKFPLSLYKKGSTGPAQAQSFDKKHGIRWKI